MKNVIIRFLIAAVAAIAVRAVAADATLAVDAAKPGHAISPTLYGIFFEDINYAADGGLYAELIQNRSFEFREPDELFAWSRIERGGAGEFAVKADAPLNATNPHYLHLTIRQPGFGIANSGYDGIPVRNGEAKLLSFYARGSGDLDIAIESADGKPLASTRVSKISNDWKKYSARLPIIGNDDKARLVIIGNAAATFDLDMVSLFPEHTFKDRPNGLRTDLAQMLADMKPGFMRFPGGCIVEGKDLANSYRWKDTIGDVAERRQNWNRWQNAVPTKAPQYYQSYGLGFFEFFQLCEDIGAAPLPVLNCGMSCQYQDKQLVPLDQLDPYVQDALDLIEWANGPADSKWGAKRAAAGHPAPFGLKFLAIGNEQWGDQYFDRYKIFHAAIKAKYPDIQLITSAGPGPDGANFDLAQRRLKTQPADIIDEHYYKDPSWFLKHDNRYDNYDRKGIKVFAGEYAAHRKDRKNSIEPAIAEATFMTGLERNSDVVLLASYAPLFARIGNTQWNVDLIWFDNISCCGTPSYYVQKLYSINRPDVFLPCTLGGSGAVPPPTNRTIYAVAGKTGSDIIIKLVNTAGEPADMDIKLDGIGKVTSASQTVLAGNPNDENTVITPRRVFPKESSIENPSPTLHRTLPANSLTILRLTGS